MNSFADTLLSILKRRAYWRPIECLWLIESVTHVTNLRWFSHGSEVNSWPWEIHWPHIKTRFIGLDTFTDKCRLPHPKLSSTTSCVPLALPSSTSQRNFVIDDTDWMGIIFHKYNTPSYSYALYKSVRMQTTNISLRERSQSSHKVPKRRRLAPSWDVVDDRPPHQLVHGDHGNFSLHQINCLFGSLSRITTTKTSTTNNASTNIIWYRRLSYSLQLNQT